MIITTALPAVIFLYNLFNKKNTWEKRHKKLTISFSTILFLGTTILIWGSFIESKLLLVNKQNIDLTQINQEIKIAFVSDIHAGPYKKTKWVEKIVQKILEQKPDIILIGGDDLYNSDYNEQELNYLSPLQNLTKQIPTYAIAGNHEYGIGDGKATKSRTADWSKEHAQKLQKLGINYLENNLKLLNIKNQNIYLFGGDSILAQKLDYQILNTREKNIPTIALIHNPAFLFKTTYPKFDLTLSGHTHGGQIRLPFLGPIGRVDSIIPADFYQGLHKQINGTYNFISSGAGESGPRARLFNPPEIVLITIK